MAINIVSDELADKLTVALVESSVRPGTRHLRERAESVLILETLRKCASTFNTDRARFLRQTPNGDWQVHFIQHDTLITHQADYAEIAMAWAVGLSRFPIRVTRPRVTSIDGHHVRPIAVTTYFGIPILCADQFVGVIELAGNVSGDLVRILERLSGELEVFGSRLTHDPSLRAAQHIDMDCECWLDGGCWVSGDIQLSPDEWKLAAQIGDSERLSSIAERVPFSDSRVIEIIRSLVDLGVVSVRASTRALVEQGGSFHVDACIAAGD